MPGFVGTDMAFRRHPFSLAALRPIVVDARCGGGRCGLSNAPRVPYVLTRGLVLPKELGAEICTDLEVDRPPLPKPWRVLCVQHSLLRGERVPGALEIPAISRVTFPRFKYRLQNEKRKVCPFEDSLSL